MRSKELAVLAGFLIAGAVLLALKGDPTLEDKLASVSAEQQQQLATRTMFADVGEVLELMHNNQIRLQVIDVRSEGDYNLFHLRDARRVELGEIVDGAVGHAGVGSVQTRDIPWLLALHPESVKIIVSNGEARAADAWRVLTALGLGNVYIMAGGMNEWVRAYGQGVATFGEDLLFTFPAALGDRYPCARPELDHVPPREFTPVVEVVKPAVDPGGGCG